MGGSSSGAAAARQSALDNWDAAEQLARSSPPRGGGWSPAARESNSFLIDSGSEIFGVAAPSAPLGRSGAGSAPPPLTALHFDGDGDGGRSPGGSYGSSGGIGGGGVSPSGGGNILSRSGRHFHVDVKGPFGMVERVTIGIDGAVPKRSPDKLARRPSRSLRSRQETVKPASRRHSRGGSSRGGSSRSGSSRGGSGRTETGAAKVEASVSHFAPTGSRSPMRPGAGPRASGLEGDFESLSVRDRGKARPRSSPRSGARPDPKSAASGEPKRGGGRSGARGVRASEASGVRLAPLRPGVARPRTGPSRVSTAPALGSAGGRERESRSLLPNVNGAWWKRAAISGVHTPSGDAAIAGTENGGMMPVDWWPRGNGASKQDGLVEITCLGRGASGTVHASLSISTLTVVAVKHIVIGGRGRIGGGAAGGGDIDPQTKAAMTEFQLLYELNHFPLIPEPAQPGAVEEDHGDPCPHIVRSYDHYFDPRRGRLGVVLEYCSGGALSDLIRQGAAGLPALHSPSAKRVVSGELSERDMLTEPQLASIMHSVLKGLEFMHSKKPYLLHRDLKPANILISHSVVPKITDFGISKMLDGSVANAKTFLGTLSYLSPERVRGLPYGKPADIWAVGKTCVALARGTEHERVNIFKMLNATDGETPHWLGADDACLPSDDLVDFSRCCLEIDPDDRMNVGELLQHPFILSRSARAWKCPPHLNHPVCTIEEVRLRESRRRRARPLLRVRCLLT
jgi:serine/threonine protein kinase